MHQERLFIVTAVSLFTALSLSPLTEAQTVVGHPYKANTRHKLTCESGQQCAWYVRQGPHPRPAFTMMMVYLSRLAHPTRPWRGSTYLDCPALLTCPTHTSLSHHPHTPLSTHTPHSLRAFVSVCVSLSFSPTQITCKVHPSGSDGVDGPDPSQDTVSDSSTETPPTDPALLSDPPPVTALLDKLAVHNAKPLGCSVMRMVPYVLMVALQTTISMWMCVCVRARVCTCMHVHTCVCIFRPQTPDCTICSE